LYDSAVLKNTFAAILDKLKHGFSDLEINQMYLHEPADPQIKRINLSAFCNKKLPTADLLYVN